MCGCWRRTSSRWRTRSTLFEVGRRQFARVLRTLPDEAFDRLGTHNRRGVLTVGGSVKDYIDHVDHHLAFLLEKRARLEKLRPQPPHLAPHAQREGEVP